MDAIRLHCRCGRSMDYDRSIDPDIPAVVVRIESTCCDKCDRGDFGTERWLDAAGKEVFPEWARWKANDHD